MRRLTNDEYGNTLATLLGTSVAQAARVDGLDPDPVNKAGYTNFADSLTVSPHQAAQYADAAARAAAAFTPPSCSGAGDACARTFITGFGKRAFRRPLTDDEVKGYVGLYTDERARSDHAAGIRQVVETMLQSSKFLYRLEIGRASGGWRALTSYEVATELSYAFTGTMPDDALFAAADGDELSKPEAIMAQAKRLLGSTEARTQLRAMVVGYAGIGRLNELAKDAQTYPTFTPALRAAMLEETTRYVDAAFAPGGDGTFRGLMTANTTYANDALASLYGLSKQGTDFAKVTLDSKQRMGLLTQASVLAAHSKANESSPILRGKMVRVALLCQSLPAPPKTVPPAPKPTGNTTARERYAEHSANAACSGCHKLMDPIGFGLENYDGVGAYRDTEGGKSIDASGALTGTLDIDGAFSGGVELAQKLASSAEARRCFALQVYRATLGRFEVDGERDVIASIEQKLASGGLDVRELLAAITTTDGFRFRAGN